jgi:hypothetical protein
MYSLFQGLSLLKDTSLEIAASNEYSPAPISLFSFLITESSLKESPVTSIRDLTVTSPFSSYYKVSPANSKNLASFAILYS